MPRSTRLRPASLPVLALALLAGALAVGGCGSGDGLDLGGGSTTGPGPVGPETTGAAVVVVNGIGLDDATLQTLEVELGWAVAAGVYWYDPVSGAVGLDGQPTAGFLPAGLPIGGALAADASAGTTQVYLNGRELPIEDLAVLEQILLAPIPPDRYFLDAEGYYGYEGDYPLGNIFLVLEQQQPPAAGGGSGGGGGVGGEGFVEETAGGWIGSDGSDSYYFDPSTGCSVMAGDGVSC